MPSVSLLFHASLPTTKIAPLMLITLHLFILTKDERLQIGQLDRHLLPHRRHPRVHRHGQSSGGGLADAHYHAGKQIESVV